MENSPLALGSAHPPLLQGAGSRNHSLVSQPGRELPGIHVLRGRDAVLSRLAILHALSGRTGQSSATRWLDFQMNTPNERKKIPTLVLVGSRCTSDADHAMTEDLEGAVILYEYKVCGCGMKVFAADDSTGQRAVIAPKHLRAQVAEAACRGLVARGALAVMLSYEDSMERASSKQRCSESSSEIEMATRERSVPLYLPLSATFEATLASLGKHTRRNLRYYRRRVEAEMATHFVPRAEMSRGDFVEINRASINPVPDAIARWRYDAFASGEEMLFGGVQSRDGRWLSLIGGRRHGSMTEIDWQMNVTGLPRLSISTVMRSYLLEHEVERGTGTLIFNGGTPHSMRHSFVRTPVVDAIALRASPAARLLRALAPVALPRKNFLVQALCDSEMCWSGV